MAEAFCGVDFGTTNSTVGLCEPGGAPVLVPLEEENLTIPSALFYSLEDGRTYFGRAAVFEYMDGAEGRFMRALKSILGTSLMKDTTQVGRERLRFEAIIGRFLRHLRGRLEAERGAAPEKVVLGRPVRFVDEDDEADRQAEAQLEAAARMEGFRHIEFQFEPVAAALSHEHALDAEQLALVVDIGGGTSDFSVLRLSPERAKRADRRDDILSTTGVHIGGTDFDRLLSMSKVMPELGLGTRTIDGKRHLPVAPYYDLSTWHRINRLYTPETLRELRSTQREARAADEVGMMIEIVEDRLGHRLVGEVEAAKIVLSDADTTEFAFELRDDTIRTTMTAPDLAAALEGSVERIEATIGEALKRAGVAAEEVDSLILTGGSTQVPVVANRLRALFPAAELVRTDVLGSVGLGLALDARRKFG